MEKCRQPEYCAELSRKRADKFKKILHIGEKELEDFQKLLKEGCGEATLRHYFHAEQRKVQRAFSTYEISEVVKEGWLIDRNVVLDGTVIVVMYHLRISNKVYRPVHVVCQMKSSLDWRIITVYDPRSMPWKWDTNYQRRVCFCTEEFQN